MWERVIIEEENPELKMPWCPRCSKHDEYNRLKHRIRLDYNRKILSPQFGDEDFLMCWACGLTVQIHEVQMKGKIAGIQGITPVENPYDFKKGKVLGTEDKLGAKGRYNKLKKKQNKHPDKEVQKLIEQGWELTSYKQVMPT
jgi:hypothetical protein